MQLSAGKPIPTTDLVLVERIATTQMSTIYRARSEHLGREFCAKVVPRSQHHERWRREIQVLATLSSPHVVKLFRTVDLDDQIVLVLDWIEGTNLGAYVGAHGPLHPTEAVQIARQLASALVDVHGLGVVHRDLKPANVMVERLPSGDLFARLLDFGISKQIDDARQSTGFVGSPLYASPEQIAEESIDARTDIYQLGCLLFFMLTGAPPFNAADAPTVMNAHLYAQPPRVSTSVPRLRRWQLDELILDMLSKSPDARPASATDLLALLDGAEHAHVGATAAGPAGDASISGVGPDRSFVTADQSHVVVRRDEQESHFDIPGATITALHAGDGVIHLGTHAGAVLCLDVSSATLDEIVQLPRARPIVAIATTARHVLAADDEGRLMLINTVGSYDVLRRDEQPPLCLSGATKTDHFAILQPDGTVVIYEGRVQRTTVRHDITPEQIALSPDGYVVGLLGEGQTMVINTIDGRVVHRTELTEAPNAITFIGGTLIGVGQTADGTHTFNLTGHS